MISCYSCASFIAPHFGGLGILHLVLYFHIALETTSHSHFPGIFFLLLGVLFFLQKKNHCFICHFLYLATKT